MARNLIVDRYKSDGNARSWITTSNEISSLKVVKEGYDRVWENLEFPHNIDNPRFCWRSQQSGKLGDNQRRIGYQHS